MKNVPKLRFKGFSDEWSKNKLSKYVINFIVPMRDKPKVFDGEIPWCRMEDIEGKYLNTTLSNQYVSTDTINEMNLKVYPKGTVLCSCSATLGICAITTRELITNQTFIGLVAGNKLLNEFLYYRMLTYSNKLNKLSTGTTIAYLSRQEFEDLLVKIPSIEEQEKIANFLSKVDKLIEKQDEKVNNLEQYKKGMMQKIFSQEIRFKKDDGGEYPEWKESNLGNYLESIGSGKTKNKEELGNYNVYGSTGVIGYTNEFDYDGEYILIARVGANAGTINRINEKCGISDNTLVIRCSNNMNYMFLEYLLVDYDLSRLIFGSGQPLVTGGQIKNIKIKIPCLDEQIKIANFLSKIDLIVEKEKEKLEELREWKKGLLQQMFV